MHHRPFVLEAYAAGAFTALLTGPLHIERLLLLLLLLLCLLRLLLLLRCLHLMLMLLRCLHLLLLLGLLLRLLLLRCLHLMLLLGLLPRLLLRRPPLLFAAGCRGCKLCPPSKGCFALVPLCRL
jgi:hypothetical protein